MKIGIVARCDVGGLGNLTYDFWKHIHQISRELVIFSYRGDNPNLYPKAIPCQKGRPTLEEIDNFLKDIDIVLAFETPYNWNIFAKAKEKGIKTILIPMYEWSDVISPVMPDLYLCPSKLDYQIFKKYPIRAEYLPIPVDRREFPFKLREKAETFVFNNGGGGTGGRNGLTELLEAIPLVKAQVKFLIRSYSQIPEIKDKRIEKVEGVVDHLDLYKEGDIFLFPHKFDGLSLPIQEALSCGMPVISTDMFPHNNYLPKEWLFEPKGFERGKVAPEARLINVATLDPKKIAEKIDEWANRDITKESKKADEIAEQLSWENLHQKYIKLFESLIK